MVDHLQLFAGLGFALLALSPLTLRAGTLSWPGETIDTWRGYKRHNSVIDACKAWVVEPKVYLERNQALKIISKSINNTDYLFIEAGGFSPKNPPAWKCPYMVLKRS
jgi:hypothetical protein